MIIWLFCFFIPIHSYTTSIPYNWFVIGRPDDFSENKPSKVTIRSKPYTIWKNSDGSFNAIQDICPHRGASFSQGRIDKITNCVVCPYHTFKYSGNGRLKQTPGAKFIRENEHFNLKTDVPHFFTQVSGGWVYLNIVPQYEIGIDGLFNTSSIWVEEEAFDKSYRAVYLDETFNIDARTVTENSLDILHISEVHAFGNKQQPLPLSQEVEQVREGHFRITYEYIAGEESIPSKVFGINNLIVQNEYILPHYTVARVLFGNFVNTIVTSALPIEEKKTKLFVKAYRNNWVFNDPLIDHLFDYITRSMMFKTVNEDKNVLETIYYEEREGNYITKYDELTRKYREEYKLYVKND